MFDTQDLLFNYDAKDIIEKDKKHLWHHIFQHKILESQDPKIFVEGEGARVKDIEGNEYLDGALRRCLVRQCRLWAREYGKGHL